MICVFCDFDGTITTRDSIVFLTEQFGAGRKYRSGALARIKSGEWSVHQAIERELATVKISWLEAVGALREAIELDPFFEHFIIWAREKNLSVQVISSGMRPVVDLFVGHLGLEIHAHPVEISSSGWRYTPISELKKVPVLKKVRKDCDRLIYVGDGTSDVCVIPYVDLLFAKKYLAEYCRQEGVDYVPFETFDDVRRHLATLL